MNIPRHVAIIMDGNGRWAKGRFQPRLFGHRNGAKRVRDIVEASGEAGVQYLTLYAFSEENWSRPPEEVNGLFKLLSSYLRDELEDLNQKNVILKGIGDRHRLPEQCRQLLEVAELSTKNNTGLQLTLALSYGGRSDIVAATGRIAKLLADKVIEESQINEELFAKHLSTWPMPDPDLLIRTSGEQRVSNFLLWEISYTEMVFVDKHWPEFTKSDFLLALETYSCRHRRYGGLKNKTNILNPLPAEP